MRIFLSLRYLGSVFILTAVFAVFSILALAGLTIHKAASSFSIMG